MPSSTILTFFGDGCGGVAPNTALPAGSTAPMALQLGDLDLLTGTWLDQAVTVRENDGQGNFSGSSQTPRGHLYINS
ncbi:hypothetical protein B0919_09765 [Hymenobacter sp. CRA2]|nr:hypothetical protein B0919_09765 [Hymenobacter sp. CRA2]